MRRLLRPAIVIPAVALLLFAAGIVYAVTTGLDSGAVDENEQVLADVGRLPGLEGGRPKQRDVRRRGGRLAGAEGRRHDGRLRAAEGTDQLEIVNYFLSRLRPDWSPEVERSLAGAAGTTTERSYRVTFSRADQCLILGTAGMVADLAQPVYTLSAYGREGDSC